MNKRTELLYCKDLVLHLHTFLSSYCVYKSQYGED
jgi:hypothetical protein